MRLALHKTTTRSASKAHLRHGGATKDVQRAHIRIGGVTKQFYSSLNSGGTSPGISVSPTSVSGSASSTSTVSITTRSTTVSVSGGVAPYSYAWTQTSGDPMTATSPSGATTAFTASVGPGTRLAGVWQCTVTDAAGTTGTVSVSASLFNRGGTL